MCKVCRWLVVSSVPWKLPYFKKAMWPAFQNLWGHGMNWWSWLVSFQQKRRSFLQLLQLPSSVEAKRRRASSIGTTLTSILCQMMMSTSLVPFFFLILGCGNWRFWMLHIIHTHICILYSKVHTADWTRLTMGSTHCRCQGKLGKLPKLQGDRKGNLEIMMFFFVFCVVVVVVVVRI